MATPNPYHNITTEEAFSTIEIQDANGNVIDPNAIKVDPDWHEWMFGDEPNYKPIRNDDDEIGDAITANAIKDDPNGEEATEEGEGEEPGQG